MQRCAWSWACVIGLSALTGCSGCNSSTPSEPQAKATSKGGAAKDKTAKSEEGLGPDLAVFDFLEAVRTGNDTKANDMLTKVAREKTAALDMVVAPPGSDTASFEVGEVEYLKGEDEGGAHVACTWTDVDEEGQSHTDNIIWMLRQEAEGWRIAGMATKIFEDELPLFLDFEDPEDMMRKQQLAEQEMQRRADAEAAAESEKDSENGEDSAESDDPSASTQTSVDDDPPAEERQASRPKARAKTRRE